MAGDDRHDIFESDAILASQFYVQGSVLPGPERSLVVAVFEDAVRCLLNHCRATDRTQRALYNDARRWILSCESDGLYAFANVCDLLGLEPDYMRRQLLARCKERRADGMRVPTVHFSHRTRRAFGSGSPDATVARNASTSTVAEYVASSHARVARALGDG